ncbi:hypothetical protein [Nisaea sp.]|uniref:hypothetical protein n=1 Tax=Nisaea sp. TaxID=2024842 RepID=UPI003267BC30
MSAPDNPDGKKNPKKTSNANQPETTASESEDANASEEKKPVAASKEAASETGSNKEQPPKPELSATKDPSANRSADGSKPQQRSKRALRGVAAAIAVLLVGGPALFAWCLSETSPTLGITVVPSGGSVACPEIAGHFEDCYLSEEVTVSAPAAAEKTGIAKFCCDFVVDRTLAIAATYMDTSGNLPGTLTADSSALSLRDGTRLTGDPVLLVGGKIPSRSMTVSAEPVFSMPLLEHVETLLGQSTGISVAGLAAAISPQSAETSRSENDIPLTEGGTMVRVSSGSSDFQQLSIRARTSASLLFSDVLSRGKNAGQILTAPGALPADSGGWLIRRIDSVGPSDATGIRAAHDALQSQSVARQETSEEAVAAQQQAGRACIAFYGALRQNFSRFDAAVATYLTARPTGLLTALSPVDRDGCKDPDAIPLSEELAADWQALDAPVVDLVMVPDSEPKMELDTTDHEIVKKLLLDFASAAKSGARLQDIEAAINDPVAIRFGRTGEAASGSRDSVLRMLHQQWTHVGCWIYAAPNGNGGMAMMLAEAQYPYLNRIVLGFDAGGLVQKVEVTGVTFDDILRFKAANRGHGCQEFLNPVRLADYRDWYADNPVGVATPSDHAERLFHEGLKRKFRLN